MQFGLMTMGSCRYNTNACPLVLTLAQKCGENVSKYNTKHYIKNTQITG